LFEIYRNETSRRCAFQKNSLDSKNNDTFWKHGHSKNGEDFIIRSHFRGDKYGRYIEVGLQMKEPMSGTWLLEWCLQWEGLRIDPVKKKLAVSEYYRPNSVHYNVGISDLEKQECFHFDDKGKWHRELVSKTERYSVRCVTLQRLLRERGWTHIDFLSVSTNGDELKVLKGIDFSNTSIQLLMVQQSGNDRAIKNLLKALKLKKILKTKDYNFFSLKGAIYSSVNRDFERKNVESF